MARWSREARTKFQREVGSVVLGVVIALALGAVATQIGWWIEVKFAKRALEVELGEALGQAKERERVEACYKARLDALAGVVDKAAAEGRLPPLGQIGTPVTRTWSHGVWDSTMDAETAAHFDRATLDNLSGTYEFIDLISQYSQREIDVWARLHVMVGPGRTLGEEEAAELRGAISEARMVSNMMGLMSVRVRQIADSYRLGYDPQTVAQYGDNPLSSYAICQSIGSEVPSTYGQAPLEGASQDARDHPITRESTGFNGR